MFKKLFLLMVMFGLCGSLSAALVHEWEFDGNMNDPVNGNNGSLISGTEQYAAGLGGQAFYFDGSTEVRKDNASGLPLAWEDNTLYADTYSMNMYVYIEELTGDYQCIGGWSRYGTYKDKTFVLRNGNLYLSHGHGFKDMSTGVYPTTGEWHMITNVFDRYSSYNGYDRVYLDGTLIAEKSQWIYASDAVVGAGLWDKSGANYFKGLLDGFTIYDHALSESEIADLYSRIPEPATIALLALGGLALLRRKSH